jgi:single-strand DNA-binding protein
MLNKVILIGRLTRDPELRYTPGEGTAVAKFTIAVDKPFSKDGKKDADFIPVVCWRKLAEHCANYLAKGLLVGVVGRLSIRSYDDKDGQRRYATEVIADEVKFLEWKKDNQPHSTNTRDSMGSMGFSDSFEDSEDDLPF